MSIYDINGSVIPTGGGSGQTDLTGAAWMQMGDSVTEGYADAGRYPYDYQSGVMVYREMNGYATPIKSKYGCTFTNWGKGGATWVYRAGQDSINPYCAAKRVDDFVALSEKPDFLTISYGFNDRSVLPNYSDPTKVDDKINNVTYNSAEDYVSVDTTIPANYTGCTTLRGCLRYCFSKLKDNCPGLRIGIILQYHPNENPNYIYLTNEIIKLIAEEYGIPCLDMYKDSNIVPAMLGDGLHLTFYNSTEQHGLAAKYYNDAANMPVCRWLYSICLENFLLSL